MIATAKKQQDHKVRCGALPRQGNFSKLTFSTAQEIVHGEDKVRVLRRPPDSFAYAALAVFDGANGNQASRLCKKECISMLMEKRRQLGPEVPGCHWACNSKLVSRALRETFAGLDADCARLHGPSAAATLILLTKGEGGAVELKVGWLGGCTAVLGQWEAGTQRLDGSQPKAVEVLTREDAADPQGCVARRNALYPVLGVKNDVVWRRAKSEGANVLPLVISEDPRMAMHKVDSQEMMLGIATTKSDDVQNLMPPSAASRQLKGTSFLLKLPPRPNWAGRLSSLTRATLLRTQSESAIPGAVLDQLSAADAIATLGGGLPAAEASVVTRHLHPQQRARLVIGSAPLWQVFATEEALAFTSRMDDSMAASTALTAAAKERRAAQGSPADDITAVVVDFFPATHALATT